MKTALKGWFFRIALALVGGLVGLAMIEGILCLYIYIADVDLPSKPPRWVESGGIQSFDEELGWVLKPDFESEGVRTNSLGFRSSSEYDLNNDEAQRVMILGDSMVFGSGEEQENIFTEVLNRQSDSRLFINAGVRGYSTWQEYLVLSKYIEKIRPQVVVLFYTQSNDLLSNVRESDFYPSVSLEQGRLVGKKASEFRNLPMYKKTFIYRFLSKYYLRGRDLSYFWNRSDLQLRQGDSYVWLVAVEILKDFASLRDQYSFELYVVDIPTLSQLKWGTGGEYRQDLLSKLCRSLNIPYFDLRDHYPSDSSVLFLENDSHYNVTGHQFIADFLESVVLRESDTRSEPTPSSSFRSPAPPPVSLNR
ncbi:MAG: SGNH/GDSL hydrolase family protein [Myxococcota bacterium]|nr:SGNH/GDSL hydrolase family protein [Myxococcota bacterium]